MTRLKELELNVSVESAMLLTEAEIAIAIGEITHGLKAQYERVRAARKARDEFFSNGGK